MAQIFLLPFDFGMDCVVYNRNAGPSQFNRQLKEEQE